MYRFNNTNDASKGYNGKTVESYRRFESLEVVTGAISLSVKYHPCLMLIIIPCVRGWDVMDVAGTAGLQIRRERQGCCPAARPLVAVLVEATSDEVPAADLGRRVVELVSAHVDSSGVVDYGSVFQTDL